MPPERREGAAGRPSATPEGRYETVHSGGIRGRRSCRCPSKEALHMKALDVVAITSLVFVGWGLPIAVFLFPWL